MKLIVLLSLLLLVGCPGPVPPPPPSPSGPTSTTAVTLTNRLPGEVEIYVAFGADSAIKAADWSTWCTVTAPLTCHFSLTGSKLLPNASGAYLNATLSAGKEVGCGSTKVELNVNNPAWYDVMDVSLVDGWNTNAEIRYTPAGAPSATVLGPTNGPTNNEKVLGVFPLGCDICTARQSPPCGLAPGADGCKAGTQYDPVPPCQVQGATKGGGGAVEVLFLGTPL